MKKNGFLGFLMCGLISTVALISPSAPITKGATLSVETTLDLIFFSPQVLPLKGIYKRANPDAKVSIIRILDDKKLVQFHPACWLVLGYIGDRTDVMRVKALIEQDAPSEADGEELKSMFSALDSLALLYQRDVAGAKELFGTLLNVQYWDTTGKRWKMTDRRSSSSGAIIFSNLIRAYARANKSDFDEQIQRVINAVPDEATRKKLESEASIGRLNELRKLYTESYGSAKPAEEAELLPRIAGKFNRDYENPGPAATPQAPAKNGTLDITLSTAAPVILHPTKAEDRAAENAIIKDAFEKFEDVKKQLAYGEVQSVKNYLLLDGTPLELSKDPEQMSIALDLVPPLHRILSSDELKEAHVANVRLESQSTFFKAADGQQDRFGELVTVSWTLEGTAVIEKAALYKKRTVPTLSNDGNLIVVMKKMNGKWYWNPFGS